MTPLCAVATLPNCGKVLKTVVLSMARKRLCGQGNDLGYSKNLQYVTMDHPQPSPKAPPSCSAMDAVQRLNGSGCEEEKMRKAFLPSLCLRYSPPLVKASFGTKVCGKPGVQRSCAEFSNLACVE
jgi:hypothetical protein